MIGPVVLVTVARVEGSGPREVGAWMAVSGTETRGTVGGGHLEFDAIARARAALAGDALDEEVRYPLGPSLGQCCGGVVWLRFERRDQPPPEPRVPVALFGGGHVGQALVRVLEALNFDLHWIDSREGVFPADVKARLEHADPVQDAVPDLAPGSHVVIMSFSHAEDLDILAAVLRRQREQRDLAFIGLIGSRTKWARFRHRLEERGFTAEELAQVHCPIGWPGLPGKRPEQIAVAIATQLLAEPTLARDVLAPGSSSA
ncbi:xanthine dehydrogenase accessory protein XdhC [Roseateles paludis]|uniref:Xanthine dehydrogenase accessory protein XdhC n=1 Tax=Roseateles paludis TaxID=3145238 RepID=A0ABV0FXM3_9BURK